MPIRIRVLRAWHWTKHEDGQHSCVSLANIKWSGGSSPSNFYIRHITLIKRKNVFSTKKANLEPWNNIELSFFLQHLLARICSLETLYLQSKLSRCELSWTSSWPTFTKHGNYYLFLNFLNYLDRRNTRLKLSNFFAREHWWNMLHFHTVTFWKRTVLLQRKLCAEV